MSDIDKDINDLSPDQDAMDDLLAQFTATPQPNSEQPLPTQPTEATGSAESNTPASIDTGFELPITSAARENQLPVHERAGHPEETMMAGVSQSGVDAVPFAEFPVTEQEREIDERYVADNVRLNRGRVVDTTDREVVGRPQYDEWSAHGDLDYQERNGRLALHDEKLASFWCRLDVADMSTCFRQRTMDDIIVVSTYTQRRAAKKRTSPTRGTVESRNAVTSEIQQAWAIAGRVTGTNVYKFLKMTAEPNKVRKFKQEASAMSVVQSLLAVGTVAIWRPMFNRFRPLVLQSGAELPQNRHPHAEAHDRAEVAGVDMTRVEAPMRTERNNKAFEQMFIESDAKRPNDDD